MCIYTGVYRSRRYSYHGREPDEARVKKCVETLTMKLEGYERILSKQKYIAGDVSPSSSPLLHPVLTLPLQELTVVDFFHLPYGTMAERFFPEVFEKNPNFYK